jgi:hypothetical protein
MTKHQWRKQEKDLYLPKAKPALIDVRPLKFVTIDGQCSPADPRFQNYIQALYSISYTIKMSLKKDSTGLDGYYDYTVYPLEGIWSLTQEAIEKYNGSFDKKDLVFKLMIRQPDFIIAEYFNKMVAFAKAKKPIPLLNEVKFETITDGPCIQMMHIGSYDNELVTFDIMEAFAQEHGYKRMSKKHREIYISDFRKVPDDKLKTVLRFEV